MLGLVTQLGPDTVRMVGWMSGWVYIGTLWEAL